MSPAIIMCLYFSVSWPIIGKKAFSKSMKSSDVLGAMYMLLSKSLVLKPFPAISKNCPSHVLESVYRFNSLTL